MFDRGLAETRPDPDPTRPGQTPVPTTVDRWSGDSPRWSEVLQQVRVRGGGSVVGSEGSFGGSEVWQQLCTRTHFPSQSLAFNEAAGIVKGPKYPCFLGFDWLAQRMDKNTPQGFGL
ncbi:hypothetical protein Tco_1508456 [Tanacetum coccineum]